MFARKCDSPERARIYVQQSIVIVVLTTILPLTNATGCLRKTVQPVRSPRERLARRQDRGN